jgi:hypothetical protein
MFVQLLLEEGLAAGYRSHGKEESDGLSRMQKRPFASLLMEPFHKSLVLNADLTMLLLSKSRGYYMIPLENEEKSQKRSEICSESVET